jgi:hypothetical protein
MCHHSDDDSGPAFDLLNAFDGIGTRSLFMTKQGYMGIGPNWLSDGDGVLLVADRTTPYMFARPDEVLRRAARRIREQLHTRKDVERYTKLSKGQLGALVQELQVVESEIGSRDGWQLVGEAYVEVIMNSEVAPQVEGLTQRYNFL